MVNICLAGICGTLQEREKNILRGVIICITHVCSVAKLYFRSLCQASHQNPPEIEWIHPKGGNLTRVCVLGCAYHVLTTQQKDTWVHMCLVVCPGFQRKVIWITRQLGMAKCCGAHHRQLRRGQSQHRQRLANLHRHRYANRYEHQHQMCL